MALKYVGDFYMGSSGSKRVEAGMHVGACKWVGEKADSQKSEFQLG